MKWEISLMSRVHIPVETTKIGDFISCVQALVERVSQYMCWIFISICLSYCRHIVDNLPLYDTKYDDDSSPVISGTSRGNKHTKYWMTVRGLRSSWNQLIAQPRRSLSANPSWRSKISFLLLFLVLPQYFILLFYYYWLVQLVWLSCWLCFFDL